MTYLQTIPEFLGRSLQIDVATVLESQKQVQTSQNSRHVVYVYILDLEPLHQYYSMKTKLNCTS